MKKTFKRTLACLLAVLMVVFSVPFTALAMDSAPSELAWWIRNNQTVTLNDGTEVESKNLTTEQFKQVDPSTISWTGIDAEGLGLCAGDQFEYTEEDDHRLTYAPYFYITVMNYGDSTTTSTSSPKISDFRNKYYGYSATYSTKTANANSTVINPADVKAGDRIAVSVEVNGIDCLASAGIKLDFDKSFVTPGYYSSTKAWAQTESASNAMKAFGLDSNYVPDAAINMTSDDNGKSWAWGDNTAHALANFLSSKANAGEDDNQTIFLGTEKGDEDWDYTYGDDGHLIFTITMEVLQDGDLTQHMCLGSATNYQVYDPTHDAGQAGDGLEYYLTADSYTYASTIVKGETVSYIAPAIWDGYVPASTPATGVTYTFADSSTQVVTDGTTPENTAASTEYDGADQHTTTSYTWVEDSTTGGYKEQASTSTEDCAYVQTAAAVDATCTTAGKTATSTCSVCGHVTGGEEIAATGHNYEGATAVAPASPSATSQHTYACVNGCGTTTSENCTYAETERVASTLTVAGHVTYTCSVCGASYTETLPLATCDHATTEVKNAKAATCTEAGYTGDTVCTNCGETIATGSVIPATGHTAAAAVQENVVDATCTTAGSYDSVVYCSVCNAEMSRETITVDALGHDYQLTTAQVDATCTTDGTTAIYTCSRCSATKGGETIPAIGHNWVETTAKVDATCTTDGAEAIYTCSNCNATKGGDVIAATGHDAGKIINAKAATITEEGYTGDRVCTKCGTVLEAGTVIPKTTGVSITVDSSALATAKTINGVDVDDANPTTVVAQNSKVTLTATGVTGATFVGWEKDGKNIVSTDETYSFTALANATYTPVYTADNAGAFTVVFTDNTGAVISAQTVTSASDIVVPTAPAKAGYTFNNWSVDPSTVTTSTTIVAHYVANAAAATYTVSCSGATINGTANELTGIPYDTKVTVKADGATSWAIDGTTVAYGSSYTFYVGANVTLTYGTDTVTAKPTVKMVNADQLTLMAGSTYKVQFLATKSMSSSGYSLVNSGFVYGKNMSTTATLADVNGSTVRSYYQSTTSDQFALNLGAKTHSTGDQLVVRAFLAYSDNAGNVSVIYTDAAVYTY